MKASLPGGRVGAALSAALATWLATPPAHAQVPADTAPVAAAPNAEIEALRKEMREERARQDARIEALQAELDAQRAAPPPLPPPPAPSTGGQTPFSSVLGRGTWGVTAFIQAQYEEDVEPKDAIQPGSVYLDQDRFVVRRGRFGVTSAWEYTEVSFELDANTTKGPAVGPKRLEAAFVLRGHPWEGKLDRRGPRSDDAPPLAKLTVGLTDVPFGFEMLDLTRDRVFMERSTASQAFFPNEQEVGARLSGGAGVLRYAVAVFDGEPTGSTTTTPVAPGQAKDIFARVGLDGRPDPSVRIAGGISGLYGGGFVPGIAATRTTAATLTQSFSHWAANADLGVRFHTPIGWSMLYGEVTLAQDLDRDLFATNPVTLGADARELGGYAAFVQELARYGLVGFRFDHYDPDVAFVNRTGSKAPKSAAAVDTFAPLAGVQLRDRARLVLEYDAMLGVPATTAAGAATSLSHNQWTLRLQVQL